MVPEELPDRPPPTARYKQGRAILDPHGAECLALVQYLETVQLDDKFVDPGVTFEEGSDGRGFHHRDRFSRWHIDTNGIPELGHLHSNVEKRIVTLSQPYYTVGRAKLVDEGYSHAAGTVNSGDAAFASIDSSIDGVGSAEKKRAIC